MGEGWGSEWNIVFQVIDPAAAAASRPLFRGPLLLLLLRALLTLITVVVAGSALAAEHLHPVASYFCRIAVLAFFILPFARLHLAGHVERIALLDVFRDELGELSKKRDAHPFGMLDHFPGLVFVLVVDGKREVGDA